MAKFKKEFEDLNPEKTAINEISSLKMMGTIDEYIAEFRPLATLTNTTSVPILSQWFLAGLPAGLHQNIARAQQPKDMEGYYNLARDLDSAFHQYLKERKETQSKNSGSKSYAKDKGRAPTQGQVQLKKLTPEDRDRLAREGRCFRCREKGHMASQCQGQPQQRQIRATEQAPAPNPAPAPVDTVAQIKALAAGLTREQKEALMEGF